MIAATPNNLNQITATGGGGAVRFKGSLNEPGKVTLNGQDAWMSQGGTIFEGNVNLSSGTNTVSVVAKDLSSPANTRTANYQVTVPSGASKSYGYDAAGNLTGDGSKTYTWDALNRLVKITYANAASSEFTYDAFGRRVKIIEKNSGGTVIETRHFIWDGMEIAERRDASGTLVRRYYPEGYVAGTSGTPSSSEKFIYLKDHLGSIRGVYSGSEEAMDVYQDFDPYGRLTLVPWTNDEVSDFGFTGHYYHQASGLTLAPFRAYDPSLGRWLSRDPIGEMGGINLYGYVLGNPVNLWDPLGLMCQSQYDQLLANMTAMGAITGSIIGGVSGGAGGGLLGAPTGPGALITGSAGAAAGAVEGGALGAAAGAALTPAIAGLSDLISQMAGTRESSLPSGGSCSYSPKKQKSKEPPRNKKGDYIDKKGNGWRWDPNKKEWDVQHPNGSHTNVGPDGNITHGPNNF